MMTDSVHPEAATSEGASAVDQVAELLSGGSEEAAKPKDLSEDYVEYPNTEETELEASGDDDEGDLETDEPNEQYDDDDDGDEDGLAALAGELGLESDKLTVNDDGDVLVNLKVNGKTEQVSLKDAISQTQYYKANEQKAQTLAEERKAFDSERQQVSENFQQQMNQVQGLGHMLEKKLQADYQAIDWDRLRVSDPAEWTAKQHEFQRAQQELQQAGQLVGEQMRQAQTQQEAEHQQWRQETLQTERAAMIESVPEWGDDKTRQSDMSDLIAYARENGFPDDELGEVTFNRHIQVLRKAMLFDKGQTVAEKKVKKAPRMQRAANGRFAGKKKSQVDRLIDKAKSAKGANKREAQADAVAAMLAGE
jgi:hypothetical protein